MGCGAESCVMVKAAPRAALEVVEADLLLHFLVIALDAPTPRDHDWLPEDFDIAAYLTLNPDLRAARVLPISHFRLHGAFEDRKYSFQLPRPARPNEIDMAHAPAKLALAPVRKG